jgi:hypothetical protein
MTAAYIRNPETVAIREGRVLFCLNKIYGPSLEQRREDTQKRLTFLSQLVEFREAGKIALVRSGRDCDGVEYDGDVVIVTATKQAVEAQVEGDLEYADGPMYFRLERPSVAKTIEHWSRDRAMEAFENGHAWSL